MRVFAMIWIGVMPKMRLMIRAKRDAGIFAMRESAEGVIGSAKPASSARSAAAISGGISFGATGERTPFEVPMIPQIAPAASRIGSLVVRHHTGLCGACQWSSSRSMIGRPVRSTWASCSDGMRPKSPGHTSLGRRPIISALLRSPCRSTSESFTAT